MTEEKFNEIKNELARLKQSQPAAISEVKRLAELGDFSENAAYQIAKGRLRGINQKILDMEEHLKRAVIIEPVKNSATVQLGSRVTVEVEGQQKTFLILGSSETDPSQGVISHHSPIGAALLGQPVGRSVTVKLKDKEVEYKIIKIE